MAQSNRDEELREKLAAIEHERWADWQKYMHTKFLEHSNGEGEYVCLSVEWFKRWERQIDTPYSELSEAEKASDMEQVDRYWQLILADRKQHELELLDRLEQSINNHTVPEGADLLTRSYVRNTIEFERERLGK